MSMQAQPKNRIPAKISGELVAFADCLNPTSTYITSGKKRVQAVFNLLQAEPDYSVSGSFFGGSVGKCTSVIYPDFDCVVFLNGKYPPLKDLLDEFEKKLREKANTLEIDVNSFTKSSITISLEFTNGVEMDLLPASCFSQDPDEQYKEVLKKLSSDPNMYLGYSSSLAQTQIKFMKYQSGLTHQLVRVAKYWYKLCTFDEHIYGGSSIIEILCVDVALDLDPDKGVTFSMLQAFKNFLQKVLVIKTLKIAFFYENNRFLRVAPKDFHLPKYKRHFYDKIIAQKNFIIEPANPYNDLAKNIKDSTAKRLKQFAEKMIARLAKLESTESNDMKTLSADGKDVVLIHYDKLFHPFIMCLQEYYPRSAIPTSVCIDYAYQNYDTAHVHAKIGEQFRSFFNGNKTSKSVYKTIMNNLLFLIRGKALRTLKKGLSFTDGITDIAKLENVKEAVKDFIDSNSTIIRVVTESSANKDHQNYHVTLHIPYRRIGKIYAVRVSLKW